MTETIPETVTEALARVRAAGTVNMFDRTGVLLELDRLSAYEAFTWLHDRPRRYVEALHALSVVLEDVP